MSPDRSRLDGRTALVTGGEGFLGRTWTAALVDAGATVVSVDVAPAVEHDGDATRSSVTNRSTSPIRTPSETLATRLADDGLAVDVLVNNAAIDAPVLSTGLADGDRLETFSLERWNTELSVGLTGAFLCAQAFGPAMAERGHGAIVNIASDLGLVAPDQRLYRMEGVAEASQPVKPVTYSVIKTGIIGLDPLPGHVLGPAGRARQRALPRWRGTRPGSGVRRARLRADSARPNGGGRRVP